MTFNLKTSLYATATAVALAATSASAAENWRAWNVHQEGHPNYAAMDMFAELVEARTGGEVSIEVFHGGYWAASLTLLSKFSSVRSTQVTSTLVQSVQS